MINENSKITQLPISVVAKIIRDEVKNPRLDTIIKIADALDVTLDELVGRKGNNYRKLRSADEKLGRKRNL